jgi:hypothetical protein
MPLSRTVESLLPLVGQGAAVFAQRLGGWALLGHLPSETGDWSYRTGAVTSSRTMRAVRDAAGGLEAMIDLGWNTLVVQKKAGSTTFPRTVLVGRSSTNDIALPHASVSKLHARLQLGGPGPVLSDAGSSNGTIVNGEQLRRDEEVALTSGDLIRFGGIALQAFSPEHLFSILERYQDA